MSRYVLHTHTTTCDGCNTTTTHPSLYKEDFSVRGCHLAAVADFDFQDRHHPQITHVAIPEVTVPVCSFCVEVRTITREAYEVRWRAALERHNTHYAQATKTKAKPTPSLDDLA